MRDTVHILLDEDIALSRSDITELLSLLSGNPVLKTLLYASISREIELFGEADQLFKGSSRASVILEEYFKLYAKPLYNKALVTPLLEALEDQETNQNLPALALLFLSFISRSDVCAPSELREVCAYLARTVRAKFQNVVPSQIVGWFIMSRGLCRAIADPLILNLHSGELAEPVARRLALISKFMAELTSKSNEINELDGLGLRPYISPPNTKILHNFLVRMAFAKEAEELPPTDVDAAEFDDGQYIKPFTQFLYNKKLTILGASKSVKQARPVSLLTDLIMAIKTQQKVLVDIHGSPQGSGEQSYSRDTLKLRGISKFWQYVNEPEDLDKVMDVTNGSLSKEVAIKLYYKGTVSLISVPIKKARLSKLRKILYESISTNHLTIRFLDGNDKVRISNQEEFEWAISKSMDKTVKLYLYDEGALVAGISDVYGSQTEAFLADIETRMKKQYPDVKFQMSSIVISDYTKPDNPLVYINDGFEKMTLHPVEQIIGRNCRYLQGRDTDMNEISKLRDAIKNETSVEVEILNYRKNGTPFWNRFHMLPLRNDVGIVTNFVAIQRDVTAYKHQDYKNWAVPQVLNWLRFLKVSDSVIQIFESNQIAGCMLLALSEVTLKSMGVNKSRTRILNGISSLVQPNNPTEETTIKWYHQDHVQVVSVLPDTSLSKLRKKATKAFKLTEAIVFNYEVNSEKVKNIKSSKDLKLLLTTAKKQNEILRLWVHVADSF